MPARHRSSLFRALVGAATSLALVACGSTRPPASTSPITELVLPATSAGPTALPTFESATRAAVERLAASWAEGEPPATVAGRRGLVVLPFIDSTSGWADSLGDRFQSTVMADLRARAGLGLEALPFTPASLARAPLVLAGTLTRQARPATRTTAPPDAWDLCLVLIDPRAGRVLAQASARARTSGARIPPAIVRDAPLWVRDAAVEAQARACRDARTGDKAEPAFITGLPVAALVATASEHYGAGRTPAARTALRAALALPGGRRADVWSGLYVAESRLKQSKEAEQAFGELVAAGFKARRMGLLLPFADGTADLPATKSATAPPLAMWWRQIAQQAGQLRGTCIDIAGHVGPGGRDERNESLSFNRAFVVRTQLVERTAALASATKVNGHGSRQMLVGSGANDASDALDRRVELRLIDC